jgi:hypothetical protein
MDGFTSTHSKTHVQERRKEDEWMDSQALTNPCSGVKGEKINGWIQKLSRIHVQKRRRGAKWMDSQALKIHVQEKRRGDNG